MIDLFFEIPLVESRPIAAAATPIRAGGPIAVPKAAPRSGSACTRAFCNEELNSRLTGDAAAAKWTVRWQTPLNPKVPPSYISSAGDRILIEGGGQWQLFDTSGKPIASARIKSGQPVMDPAHSLVYAVDQDGALSAYRFADGQRAYTTSLSYGDTFWRTYLARSGNRLVAVGVEVEAYPHRPAPPNKSVIDIRELADPLRVDPNGALLSVRSPGNLRTTTSMFAVAMHGDTLAFAVPNRVYFGDLNFKINGAFEDSFDPIMLSLDEDGRIYLLVKRGQQQSLWVLTPQGQRVLAYDIPAQFGLPSVPPIVGYNHEVFLMGAGGILAIHPDGRLAWQQPTGGFAAVSANDELVVASGNTLAAFNSNGTRRVLWGSGDPLRTPPATMEGGDILVASVNRLYRLTPGR